MTVTLGLSARAETRLRERAKRHGVDVDAYVEDLVLKDLGSAPQAGAASLAEILSPVHDYTRAQGDTDEEIGQFVDAEIRAYRAERRAAQEALHPHA